MSFNVPISSLITPFALAIAPQLSNSELSLVAAVLTQLGDTFATIAVEREIREAEPPDTEPTLE